MVKNQFFGDPLIRESKIKLENIDACMSNGGSFMTGSFSRGQVCVLLEESSIYNCLKMES
jgi:hypothetical protein